MTETRYINNTPVSISDYHHEAIMLWSRIKRENPSQKLTVITLDHHTDTVQAYRGAGSVVSGEWKDDVSVSNAIKNLKHDEHIDWALKSGAVDRAIIIPHVNMTIPADPMMSVLHDRRLPEEFVQLNEPEIFRPFADNILDDTFLVPLLGDVPSSPWILDIDCDNFLTQKSLAPDNHILWHKLIKNAVAISISLESDYVKILRLRGESVTGSNIAAHLLQLFERLLA